MPLHSKGYMALYMSFADRRRFFTLCVCLLEMTDRIVDVIDQQVLDFGFTRQ